MYAGSHEIRVMGERERLDHVKAALNACMLGVDFSMSQTALGGEGGIPEIRSTLEMIQETRQRKVGMCVIDWAGTCVRRTLRTQGNNVDRQAAELGAFIQDVRSTIAGPMGCATWVVHQLNGQANKRPPSHIPTHADAEWCASFAVNAWFALCLGTKDQESNSCLLAATKTRRGAGSPAILCHINGAFGELVPGNGTLRIDPHTHRIVPTDGPAVTDRIGHREHVADRVPQFDPGAGSEMLGD
jgi:hypothetical protein